MKNGPLIMGSAPLATKTVPRVPFNVSADVAALGKFSGANTVTAANQMAISLDCVLDSDFWP